MSSAVAVCSDSGGKVFAKETLIKGQPAKIRCVNINGQTYNIAKDLVTVVSLEDEWYEDVKNPTRVIDEIKSRPEIGADLFTFWQRVPNLQPEYQFDLEWESVSALPITTTENWFNKQISGRTRSLIRKAKKDGVEARPVEYDDEFIRGMTEIFNETPIRQGRRFWHYGKDFKTVKEQFSRYLFREQMIGAYLGEELIGFIMLGDAGRYALTGQIISKIKHRDKSTNNVLIAKAVEICVSRKLPYLVYFYWTNDSLAEFKRRCGFQEMRLPRYFVPLTEKGKVAFKLRLHRGWKAAIPDTILESLKRLRRFWNDRR